MIIKINQLDVKIKKRVLFTVIEQTTDVDPFVDVNRRLQVMVPFRVKHSQTMPETCEFDDSDFVVPETIEVIETF